MKVKFKFNDGVISLPKEIYSYLAKANEVDAKVIYAIAMNEELDIEEISKELNITEDEINLSLGFWRGTGIIELSGKNKKKNIKEVNVESVEYTSDDVEKLMESNPELSIIIKKCEEVLEKTFSYGDSKVIIYLYDHLNLPADYIILLCQHMKNNNHCGLRYIEKTAINLYDQGITTSEQLYAYLMNRTKVYEVEKYVRSLFGLGSRALTPKEEEIITSWNNQGLSEEQLRNAYNIMMNAIDKPSLKYMDKILQTENQLFDKSESTDNSNEVKKKKYSKKKASKETNDSSFDVNDFFANNIKNSIDN